MPSLSRDLAQYGLCGTVSCLVSRAGDSTELVCRSGEKKRVIYLSAYVIKHITKRHKNRIRFTREGDFEFLAG